jgi:hypothetical protein
LGKLSNCCASSIAFMDPLQGCQKWSGNAPFD